MPHVSPSVVVGVSQDGNYNEKKIKRRRRKGRKKTKATRATVGIIKSRRGTKVRRATPRMTNISTYL